MSEPLSKDRDGSWDEAYGELAERQGWLRSKEPRHEVLNGGGTVTRITCEEFERYVEAQVGEFHRELTLRKNRPRTKDTSAEEWNSRFHHERERAEEAERRLGVAVGALENEVLAGLAQRLIDDLDAIEARRNLAVYELDARLVARSYLRARQVLAEVGGEAAG